MNSSHLRLKPSRISAVLYEKANPVQRCTHCVRLTVMLRYSVKTAKSMNEIQPL